MSILTTQKYSKYYIYTMYVIISTYFVLTLYIFFMNMRVKSSSWKNIFEI